MSATNSFLVGEISHGGRHLSITSVFRTEIVNLISSTVPVNKEVYFLPSQGFCTM